MKSPLFSRTSRRAATIILVLAAATGSPLLAQTAAGTKATGSKGESAVPKAPAPTSATGSGYNSGVAPADADSTHEINARTARPLAGDRLAGGDRRFIMKVADAEFTTAQSARAAADRASNPDVRAFAQKLLATRTSVTTELVELASQKGVLIEKEPGSSRAFNRLTRKTGAEFDREFLDQAIDAHEDLVKLFDKASSGVKDPELKVFATRHLAEFKEHLQTAQSLESRILKKGTDKQ